MRIEKEKPQACDLVYVGGKVAAQDPRIKTQVGKHGVVTISDAKDFAKRGGIIELYRTGSKVRFEIRNDAARKVGVEISSKLLRLAVPRPRSLGD